MLIRRAQEDDAEQLAQAEYDTAASKEGLLAAKPHEIPISAFRSKIKQLGVEVRGSREDRAPSQVD